MLVVPAPTMVNVLPETVATEVLELVYETGKLELAVAVSAKEASPTSLSAKAANDGLTLFERINRDHVG
jgi:hypothetical protein